MTDFAKPSNATRQSKPSLFVGLDDRALIGASRRARTRCLAIAAAAALFLSACGSAINAPVAGDRTVEETGLAQLPPDAQAVPNQSGVAGAPVRSLLWDNRTQTHGLRSPQAPTWPAPGSGIIFPSTTRVACKRGQPGNFKLIFDTKGLPAARVFVEIDGSGKDLLVWQAPRSWHRGWDIKWIFAGQTCVFKLYSMDGVLLDSCRVVGYEYKVGVNYYSTRQDDLGSAFLTDYHLPECRALVRQQLKAMADAGAAVITTPVWPAAALGDPAPSQKYLWHFPPTRRELDNLRLYVQDVANTVANDGHTLALNLSVLRLWGSSTRFGSPTTTLGKENLTAEAFIGRMKTTHKSLIDAVYDIRRENGKPVVERFYGDGCVQVANPALPNEGWFLKSVYPDFVAYCQSRGLTPSLYFNGEFPETAVMNDRYVDPDYPQVLNGRQSMARLYRTIKFLVDNRLYLPNRIDFALYLFGTANTAPNQLFTTYSFQSLVTRVLEDADKTLPTLGAPRVYSFAEIGYPGRSWNRQQLGDALAFQRWFQGRLDEAVFWPTFDGVSDRSPYVFGDFLRF